MIKRDIQQLLKELNVTPKKSKGQNFVIDPNFIKKIILLSDICDEDIVLEIGPGLGGLTKELIKRAKKVITVEIESKFCSYLSNQFNKNENLEIVNDDILVINLPEHDKVIANLPYNITGPILEKIFFKEKPPQGILCMEESLAKRIFNLQNYNLRSRISINVNSYMIPEKIIPISPKSFYPNPKISLALVKLLPKPTLDLFLTEEKTKNFYLKFIAGIMPYKNKNLVNSIELFFNKNEKIKLTKNNILDSLEMVNINNEKTFKLSINDILDICKQFYKIINDFNS